MVEYTWTFPSLERNPRKVDGKSDTVTAVHWRLQAKDGDFHAEAYGSVTLPPPGGTFVAYKDLTPEEVTKWVEGAIDVGKTKAALAEALNELAKPSSVTETPPWA